MLLKYFAEIDGETLLSLFSFLLFIYIIVSFEVAWVLRRQTYNVLM